jgi:hypothetical protein
VPYRVVEDAFFSPKLLEIGLEIGRGIGGLESEGALKCGSVKFALPLTADFFRFFSIQTLASCKGMLTVREDNDEVRVRLQIPLCNGGYLGVDKTYGRYDIARLPDNIPVPVLALWPDFGVEDWEQNYAAFAVEPHPWSEAKLLAAPILDDGSVLEPTVEDTKERPRQSTCRVWCASRPVIGFALYLRDARGEVNVGVVLRESLREPHRTQPARQWDVGIDFGTSNTRVMVCEPGYEPRALTFGRRTLILTSAPEASIPPVTRNLFPCVTDPLPPRPLPTALRIADATRCPDLGGEVKWAELNFGPERNFFATNLVANVKWGTPGAAIDDDSIQRYLSGLLRAVLCEARDEGIGRLRFQWSYPQALPKGPFSAMNNFWNKAGGKVNATAEIRVGRSTGMTESEAVCRYFRTQPLAKLPVNASSLSVAIDVGGGSSDMAFWLAGQLVDISSFKLAANDILVPAVEFPGFAEQLVTACGADGVAVETLRRCPEVVINALLTQAKDGRERTCDLKRPRDHPLVHALFSRLDSGAPPWLPVRSAIYLFFMGLTYYAGLHARDIVARYCHLGTARDAGARDVVSVRERVPLIQHRQIGVHFGGLGSSLLTWVSGDGRLLRNALEFAFHEGLTLDYPDGSKFDVNPSGAAIAQDRAEHPKEEVVQGLMVAGLATDHDGASPPQGFETSTILCEIGWMDAQGKEVEWNARLTAERLREMRAPWNHDSGYMAQFLGSVLLRRARELVVDHEALGRLEIDGAQLQDLMVRSCQKDQTVLQPIFAYELKTVLEQCLRMASR